MIMRFETKSDLLFWGSIILTLLAFISLLISGIFDDNHKIFSIVLRISLAIIGVMILLNYLHLKFTLFREIKELKRTILDLQKNETDISGKNFDKLDVLNTIKISNELLKEIDQCNRELRGLLDNLRLMNQILRHDLLNDLFAVRGYIEMEKNAGKYSQKILETIEKATGTVKRIKDIEKIISFEDLRPYNLKRVIESVISSYDIEWEINGEGQVMADPGIYSIFDNLISNAIKHGKARKIVFDILNEGDYIHVIVRDYGMGIPEEIIGEIFNEGFSSAGSSGLGLYIVRKLMEKYDGKVRAENYENGAVFHLYFKNAERIKMPDLSSDVSSEN